MFLIKELTDATIWETFSWKKSYKIRKSARAIVMNDSLKIPLLYAKKDDYYKLPWWWIDDQEDIYQWLKREFLEEVGVEIEIDNELGCTIEIKDQHEKIQFSYVYIGKIIKYIWEPQFTAKEIEDWLELHWYTQDEILNKLEQSSPKTYVWKMIKARDISIFKYFLQSKN